jgi:uncharacterized protein YodC (DUF2158 family)
MTTEATFKVGTTVQLKSGGPGMTIERVDINGIACAWFAYDAATVVCRDTFAPLMLQEWAPAKR